MTFTLITVLILSLGYLILARHKGASPDTVSQAIPVRLDPQQKQTARKS